MRWPPHHMFHISMAEICFLSCYSSWDPWSLSCNAMGWPRPPGWEQLLYGIVSNRNRIHELENDQIYNHTTCSAHIIVQPPQHLHSSNKKPDAFKSVFEDFFIERGSSIRSLWYNLCCSFFYSMINLRYVVKCAVTGRKVVFNLCFVRREIWEAKRSIFLNSTLNSTKLFFGNLDSGLNSTDAN